MGCSNSRESAAQSPNNKPDSLAVTVVGSETALSTNLGDDDADNTPIGGEAKGKDRKAITNGSSSTSSSGQASPLPSAMAKTSKPGSNANQLPKWDRKDPQRACFGAGCYWGTEKFFRHDFAKKYIDMGNIHEGKVGFMGPADAPKNPSYRDVCTGATGHVEVYDFEFSGGNNYYRELVKYFFQFHDPTTLNRQGNDRGTQYASVIYCYTDEQVEIAKSVKEELQELINSGKIKGYKEKVVTTDIRRSTKFYPAHQEHQDYLMQNPNGYCNHRIRFGLWPQL
jgi:peptide-methionine (S)-S-oxide reductase